MREGREYSLFNMLLQDTPFKERMRRAESLFRTRAITSKALEHQAQEVKKTLPVDGFDPRKADHQMGKGMWSQELCTKLSRLVDPFIVIDSLDHKSINILKPVKTIEPDGGVKTRLILAVALEKGWTPEFSIVHPVYDTAWDTEKNDLVPTLNTVRETRGWRTVLTALLNQGMLTASQVREHFPYQGQFSLRQSWKLKNQEKGI